MWQSHVAAAKELLSALAAALELYDLVDAAAQVGGGGLCALRDFRAWDTGAGCGLSGRHAC